MITVSGQDGDRMDNAEKKFQLLMSEKEFADSQIGGFFDLQVKIFTFLGAAVVLLGWIYSDRPKPLGDSGLAVSAIAFVVIGCSVMLQGITMYGTSLSYLEYKTTTLNDELQTLLALPKPPLNTLGNWRSSPTQPPVMLATMGLTTMHIVVNVVLIYVAWQHARSPLLLAAVVATAIYEVLTITSELLVMRALVKLMHPKRDAAATTV
jgi:hypothetical protein